MDNMNNYMDISSFRKGDTLDIYGSLDVSVPAEYMVNGDVVQTEFSGYVSFDGEDFSLSLNVNAVFSVPCARCLKDTQTEFEFSVSETYGKTSLADDKIDLHEVMSAGVFSEIPAKVLCRGDCKGLCQFCGRDKNEADCGCVKPVSSMPIDTMNEIKALLKEV